MKLMNELWKYQQLWSSSTGHEIDVILHVAVHNHNDQALI